MTRINPNGHVPGAGEVRKGQSLGRIVDAGIVRSFTTNDLMRSTDVELIRRFALDRAYEVAGHSRTINELQAQLAAAEQSERNLRREFDRLKRENAELRSRGKI